MHSVYFKKILHSVYFKKLMRTWPISLTSENPEIPTREKK